MAFPLSSFQQAQIFQIFGLPQQPGTFAAFAIASLFGPAGEPFDHTRLITQLNAQMAQLSSDQCTLVTTDLTQWLAISPTDPLHIVEGSSGVKGDIVNRDKERELIRQDLANIIGFYVPPGGWIADIKRRTGQSGPYIGR